MIEEIKISCIGALEQANLQIKPGIVVLTGETGAGKTMVLTSLAMLQGQKVSPERIREGSAIAQAEAQVLFSATDTALVEKAESVGAILDEFADQLVMVVERQIQANGRSKAFLGGRAVAVANLKTVMEDLLTIHGQSEQMRLKSETEQRRALDRASGEEGKRARDNYSESRIKWMEAQEALEKWQTEQKELDRQTFYIQTLVNKVQAVNPQPGEINEVIAQTKRLEHWQEYTQALNTAKEFLLGDECGVCFQIAQTAQALEMLKRAAGNSGELISEWINQLFEVKTQVENLSYELDDYQQQLESPAVSLNDLHARRAQLVNLQREIVMDLDEAIEAAADAENRISQVGDPAKYLHELETEVETTYAHMCKAGLEIRQVRMKYADLLQSLVEKEIQSLAIERAQFEIRVSPLSQPGPHGFEDVSFYFSARPNSPLRALGSGASGGEISRVMLALELAMAQISGATERRQTFIFDEVDAGIGGATALEIGRRLAALGKHHQVLVVTHLAQVAAFGDQHFVVKAGEQAAEVNEVAGEERVAEIARMLAGTKDSPTALRHAQELIDSVNA